MGGVIVIQQGARRNYAYACQLEAEGLLTYLATDAAWSEASPGITRHIAEAMPRLRGAIGRRTVAGIQPQRLFSSWTADVVKASRAFLEEELAFDLSDEAFGWQLRARGLGDAKVVVNYFGNGGSFLDHAKKKGATIVTDFISSPQLRQIEKQANEEWPAWGERPISQASVDRYRRRFVWLLSVTDVYLCPSQSVAEDISQLPGFVADRLRIVPYGASGAGVNDPAPIPGRILFAGAGLVRKGLPYLAEAARLLTAGHPHTKVIVAGSVSDTVRGLPDVTGLRFVGHLDRAGMQAEMARADVFCLPSLSEGSATVVYEAMACGLPVVTTRESGSVVRDGIDGFIVPLKDGRSIAAALTKIVTDRARRTAMSDAARARAAEYSDARCAARFIEVIRECLARAG